MVHVLGSHVLAVLHDVKIKKRQKYFTSPFVPLSSPSDSLNYMARPKKVVEEKKVPELSQTPSKITSVVFTIPTSFSYESVKVEMSGVADNAELVEKYNELVELFRPKPKPTPVKEPMKSYSVPRKVPAADDEAGGAVIQDAVDNDTLTLQKLDVVALLEEKHAFMCKGKTRKEISDKVFDLTGVLLADDNLEAVIDGLKK